MNKRNTGITEQAVLQNEFTAFVTISLDRYRLKYLTREARRKNHTYEMEEEKFALIPDGSDFVANLCESDALAYALRQLDERERYVLIARVLEDKELRRPR